jgi:hypothetical protein
MNIQKNSSPRKKKPPAHTNSVSNVNMKQLFADFSENKITRKKKPPAHTNSVSTLDFFEKKIPGKRSLPDRGTFGERDGQLHVSTGHNEEREQSYTGKAER